MLTRLPGREIMAIRDAVVGFLETALDDGGQDRGFFAHAVHRRRVIVSNRLQTGQRIVVVKRVLSGEQLVEQNAQRKDVQRRSRVGRRPVRGRGRRICL